MYSYLSFFFQIELDLLKIKLDLFILMWKRCKIVENLSAGDEEKIGMYTNLDCGRESCFFRLGHIGGPDDQVVEGLILPVQRSSGEDAAITGDGELFFVISTSNAVLQLAVNTCTPINKTHVLKFCICKCNKALSLSFL